MVCSRFCWLSGSLSVKFIITFFLRFYFDSSFSCCSLVCHIFFSFAFSFAHIICFCQFLLHFLINIMFIVLWFCNLILLNVFFIILTLSVWLIFKNSLVWVFPLALPPPVPLLDNVNPMKWRRATRSRKDITRNVLQLKTWRRDNDEEKHTEKHTTTRK